MPQVPAPVQTVDAPHPVLGAVPGPDAFQLRPDPDGLARFGVFVKILPPGNQSSFRHLIAQKGNAARARFHVDGRVREG